MQQRITFLILRSITKSIVKYLISGDKLTLFYISFSFYGILKEKHFSKY